MDPADLERQIGRELRRLPSPRAPHTLLPRVMAAVAEARRRPWHARAWLTWPVGWQVVSVLLLIGVAGVGARLLPNVLAAASVPAFVARGHGYVSEVVRNLDVVATAVRVVWRTLLAPVVPYAFGLVFLMCVACAVVGTALNHLVFGKALR